MIHYTFNTGHWVESQRSQVSQLALDALAPLTVPGVHRMPVFDDLEVKVNAAHERAGFAVLGHLKEPILVAGVTWTLESQRFCARKLELLHAATGVQGAPAHKVINASPKSVPWLGVVLLSGIRQLGQRIAAIADFELCMAWALIERYGG